MRARFQSFIDTRSRATPMAVGFAVASVEQETDLHSSGERRSLRRGASRQFRRHRRRRVRFAFDRRCSRRCKLRSKRFVPWGRPSRCSRRRWSERNVSMMLSTGAGAASAELGSTVASAVTAYIDSLPARSVPVIEQARLCGVRRVLRRHQRLRHLDQRSGRRRAWVAGVGDQGPAPSRSASMTGDQADMGQRIRSVLPTRWFPDVAPVPRRPSLRPRLVLGVALLAARLRGRADPSGPPPPACGWT